MPFTSLSLFFTASVYTATIYFPSFSAALPAGILETLEDPRAGDNTAGALSLSMTPIPSTFAVSFNASSVSPIGPAFAPDPHQHPDTHSPHSLESAIIATVILVGLCLVAALLGLAKCMQSYWRTPRYDHVAARLDRQRVEREIMHAEQELAVGSECWTVPPPPYFLQPPTYAESDASLATDNAPSEPDSCTPGTSTPGASSFRAPEIQSAGSNITRRFSTVSQSAGPTTSLG
ncbi:hypothetical protein FB451DRAFT_1366312 [Mycena latifolia]|nr:hypothetical protein FB451DRAFT_1366312 [Mycena latifolia]